MKMPETLLATIPFSGFYCSYHDSQMDDALERAFQDQNGHDQPWTAKLGEHFHSKMDWHEAQCQYAKDYVAAFSDYIGVPMEFESMQSPREYNFTTDRIFVNIKNEDFWAMWKKLQRDNFVAKCKERFTNRSGFISFYNPDFRYWKNMAEWDFNQFGTVTEAYADQVAQEKSFTTFDEQENSIVEDFSGNGNIDNYLWGNCKEGNRLSKIHEYLSQRAERI